MELNHLKTFTNLNNVFQYVSFFLEIFVSLLWAKDMNWFSWRYDYLNCFALAEFPLHFLISQTVIFGDSKHFIKTVVNTYLHVVLSDLSTPCVSSCQTLLITKTIFAISWDKLVQLSKPISVFVAYLVTYFFL